MKKTTVFIIVLIVITVLGIIIFRLIEQYDEYKNRNRVEPYIANTNINPTNITQSDNNIDNELEKYFPPIIERSMDKVSATVKEGTLTRTGVTLIITDDNIPPFETYGYNMYLYIRENGEWIPYHPINYFYSSNEVGSPYPPERITEKEINWSESHGELGNGEYLLLLTVFQNYDYEKSTFGVEFTIE